MGIIEACLGVIQGYADSILNRGRSAVLASLTARI